MKRFALAVLFLPFAALAQPAPEVKVGAADIKSTLLSVFVQYLLVPITIAVAGVLTAALLSARKWLEAHAQNSLLARAGTKLDDVLISVVQDIEANEKAELEEAAKDGVITPEEAAKLKAGAIGRAKAILGERGLEELKKAFGFSGMQLEQFLSAKVEQMAAKVAASPK